VEALSFFEGSKHTGGGRALAVISESTKFTLKESDISRLDVCVSQIASHQVTSHFIYKGPKSSYKGQRTWSLQQGAWPTIIEDDGIKLLDYRNVMLQDDVPGLSSLSEKVSSSPLGPIEEWFSRLWKAIKAIFKAIFCIYDGKKPRKINCKIWTEQVKAAFVNFGESLKPIQSPFPNIDEEAVKSKPFNCRSVQVIDLKNTHVGKIVFEGGCGLVRLYGSSSVGEIIGGRVVS